MTRIEAEALAFARGLVARFHVGTTPWSSDSPLTEAGSRAFVRDILRRGALWSATNRMDLIALARAGDADAADILKNLIIETKSARQELPVELENYAMELLHGASAMGHQPPGAKKKNKFLRNICIATIVAAVVDRFDIPPTGRSPQRRSACAIVAEALTDARMRLGDKAVEAVWRAYGRAMPTVPGWAGLFLEPF